METAAAERIDVPSYDVGERIGAGGFGEVFAARHAVLKRDAAIKILHAKYSANADTVARFVAEARAVSMISHPAIVELFELGVLPDGRHYFVMERLRGQTLRDLLRERGRLPLDEALPILRQIASAVDAAHAVGIAHRDLKPDNVFVLPDGSVKLIDFGLAKLTTDADTPVTQTGSVFGTPLYMSPEQCRGKAPDLRTDAYSFGALAYHVLTGTTPFTGEALELALHHLNDRPVRPSKHTELPRRVDDVVLALLAKDPADRPMPLSDAVSALAGDLILRRRRKLWRWALALGALLVVGGVTYGLSRRSAVEVDDRPEMCSSSAVMLDGVWDPMRRGAIAGRFAMQPRPDIDATWRVMSSALDDLFGQWSTRWDDACVSGERRADPLLHAQRLNCLERMYFGLRGHADALASAEPSRYARRFDDSTIHPLDCNSVAELRAEPAQLPPDKRALAAVHIRSSFDRSYSDRFFEHRGSEATNRMVAQSKRDAEALEALGSPFAVNAWVEHYERLASTDATLAELRTPLAHAAALAKLLRFDAGLALAEWTRARLETRKGAPAEARAAMARADLATAAAGNPRSLIRDAAIYRASIAALGGDLSRGISDLQRVIEEEERSSFPLRARRARHALLTLYILDGRYDAAGRIAEQNVATTARLLGPTHTLAALARMYLVEALFLNGEIARATSEASAIAAYATALEPHVRDWALKEQAGLAAEVGDLRQTQTAFDQWLAADPTRGERERWLDLAKGGLHRKASERAVSAALAAPASTVLADRLIHDYEAKNAYARGDFVAMAATAANGAPIPSTRDQVLVAPWLVALAATRSGNASLARQLIEKQAYVHELGARGCVAFSYDALVLVGLDRWDDALARAERGDACATDRASGYLRMREAAMHGIILAELGHYDRAREPLEVALAAFVFNPTASELLPAARFSLARALYVDVATRPRALRLAAAARDGFEQMGKFREHQRQAVVAWLADPTMPVAVHMLP